MNGSGNGLTLTVLGSGTSVGVPTIGCHCDVCTSTDPRDRRLRPSVWLRYGGRSILIDTTPDFRYQALRAGIKRLDAVIYTHGHADHILGLDDIRPFNLKQRSDLPVYAAPETLAILRRTFAYIFDGVPTLSTVPGVVLNEINGPFDLFGARVTPIPAQHGDIGVLGFRIGRLAYLTDFSTIPAASLEFLRGADHLVLDALRHTPHPMHSTVQHSLELVDALKPRHAWFTHIAHDLGHEETNATLPPNVRLAYDGLALEAEL